jgi:hypothetical protein
MSLLINELLPRLLQDSDFDREMTNLGLKAYHGAQQRAGLKWRNGRWPCMYPGCQHKAIGSHTLQKSNSLEAIAEGPRPGAGVVVTPKFDPAFGDRIDTNLSFEKASIFPGFCGDHDRELFKHLESTSGTPDPRALVLQCCRTFSRERRVHNHAHETSKAGYDAMVHDQHEAIGRRLEGLAGKPLTAITGFRTAERFQYDANELRRIRHGASAQWEFVKSFEKLAPSVDDFYRDSTARFPQMFIKTWAVSTCLDFALSGADDIGLSFAPIPIFYFVMPRSGVSHLAVFSHIDDEAILAALLQQKGLYDLKPGQTGAGLFRFFEQLMINRTNHWFLRLSAWERLPDDDKKRLADEVNIHERPVIGDGTPIFAIPEGLEVTRNAVWRPSPLR